MKLVFAFFLAITMTDVFAGEYYNLPTKEELIADIEANGKPCFFVEGLGYEIIVDGKKRVNRPLITRIVKANEKFAVVNGDLMNRCFNENYFVDADKYIHDLEIKINRQEAKLLAYHKEHKKIDSEHVKLTQEMEEMKEDLKLAKKILKSYIADTMPAKNSAYLKLSKEKKIEYNRNVIRAFETCINTYDLELGRQLISDAAEFMVSTSSNPLVGPEGFLCVVERMRASFPDVHWKIVKMIADENMVAVQWQCTGTFSGKMDFTTLAPNGKKFSTTVMNFYTFDKEGKIFDDVAGTGIGGILQGIGAISLPDIQTP